MERCRLGYYDTEYADSACLWSPLYLRTAELNEHSAVQYRMLQYPVVINARQNYLHFLISLVFEGLCSLCTLNSSVVHLVPSSVENKQVIRQKCFFFFFYNKRTDIFWRFVRTDYGEIMIMEILRLWRK